MKLPMGHEVQMRRCLEALDIEGIKKLWAHLAPHMVTGSTDHDILMSLHMARTQAKSIALKLRAYSHRWLLDNGYPSALPEDLKPKAEQMFPKIVTMTGISVNSKYQIVQDEIGGAMHEVAGNCYADGNEDQAYIKRHMLDARLRARKRLGLPKP